MNIYYDRANIKKLSITQENQLTIKSLSSIVKLNIT